MPEILKLHNCKGILSKGTVCTRSAEILIEEKITNNNRLDDRQKKILLDTLVLQREKNNLSQHLLVGNEINDKYIDLENLARVFRNTKVVYCKSNRKTIQQSVIEILNGDTVVARSCENNTDIIRILDTGLQVHASLFEYPCKGEVNII